MPTLPPTTDCPLLVTTRDDRVISCAVRSLRRNRSSLRWVFVTDLRDSHGFRTPTSFIGPRYRKGEHDNPDAIRALVAEWWESHNKIENPNGLFLPPSDDREDC
jgi:hypothetical protein